MTGRADAPVEPIENYALVGDCQDAALVARGASIDWCTLLPFDGEPVFFRLLDPQRGGFWTVEVEAPRRITRASPDRTNLLRTRFETAHGTPDVVDCMPVGRSRTASVHDYLTLNAPGWLVRRLVSSEGEVRPRTRCHPRRCGFDLQPPTSRPEAGRVLVDGGFTLWCEGEATQEDAGVGVAFTLRAGDVRTAVLTSLEPLTDPGRRADEPFETTRAVWREWSEYSRYRGAHAEAVQRSALALELLTFAPTGAIVAAPTTSLPETLGGDRTWDYRFCWIRDATFALFAVSVLGYSAKGGGFRRF